MIKKYTPANPKCAHVKVSEFRRRMSHYIAQVRHGNDFVAIHRKDEDPVYLISKADWDLLDRKIVDLEHGKMTEKHGRQGGLWDLLNWEYRWKQADEYLKSRGE